MRRHTLLLASAACLALTACGLDQAGKTATTDSNLVAETQTTPVETPTTPVSGKPSAPVYPSQVYWGDTHLHTADSADAFAFGGRVGPEDALRFARGEKVTSSTGLDAQLDRPLDFLVIADHAEGLGITREIYNGNPDLIADPRIRRWHEMMNESPEASQQATRELIDGHAAGTNPEMMGDLSIMVPILRSVWTSRGDVVETYNEPGSFTAFIGFEYTSLPDGDNLHRVVIFRDGTDKTNGILPFSSTISEDPEDLWSALAQYEMNTGGRALAIPHNSNVSNGRMFAMSDFEGNPIDADYAKRRAKWEPLVEATQYKGDSESHPFLSPNDEFAGFGDAGWELGNLNLSGLKTDDMLAGDYVREALKRGLAIEAETGANPFKLGMIGSTDAHTGLSTADEDNFFGKHAGMEPRADRMSKADAISNNRSRQGWQYLSSGYAAVWATENTREALFDAMMRKEVYATTGPRMTLRVFGGRDFTADDLTASDAVARGYQRGVPMGGDLPAGTTAPTLMITAMMDPEGANLDRVQVVKGWIDGDGATHERVYDVAWSGDRTPGADGKLAPVGNTVDLSVPSWSNTIGAPSLQTVWTDPDFDPGQAAFYYVRALEIPTPRWTAYDAVRFGVEPGPEVELISQQRAYSSPIWHAPE